MILCKVLGVVCGVRNVPYATSHGHASAGHSHAAKNFGPAFAIGTALNVGPIEIQVCYGIKAHFEK
jgi:hypothetical protein